MRLRPERPPYPAHWHIRQQRNATVAERSAEDAIERFAARLRWYTTTSGRSNIVIRGHPCRVPGVEFEKPTPAAPLIKAPAQYPISKYERVIFSSAMR